MLSHLAVEFGVPCSDSTRQAIPTTRINPRNGAVNAKYSEKRLPKIIDGSPSQVQRLIERTSETFGVRGRELSVLENSFRLAKATNNASTPTTNGIKARPSVPPINVIT